MHTTKCIPLSMYTIYSLNRNVVCRFKDSSHIRKHNFKMIAAKQANKDIFVAMFTKPVATGVIGSNREDKI